MIWSGLHFRFALATMCSGLEWQVGSQGYELEMMEVSGSEIMVARARA